MPAHLGNHVAKLADKIILVVGDLVLDEYITGRATRMSREAPVPVLEMESKRYIAGGAANPAANIVALGSRALQVGVIGNDDSGKHLLDVVSSRGIDCAGIVTCDDRPTTVKTRILAQMGLRFPQQVTRIDTVSRLAVQPGIEAQLIDFVREHIHRVDAVLLSHYHGGLLTASLVQEMRQTCTERNVLLTADVQGQFNQFAGVDVLKCNAADAQRLLSRKLQTDEDFGNAARKLRQELKVCRATIITRGSRGATLATEDTVSHCPAPRVSDVFDTVGAGDTAIAVMTLALTAGVSAEDAVTLANHASGIVVRHLGNYAPTPGELAHSIENHEL